MASSSEEVQQTVGVPNWKTLVVSVKKVALFAAKTVRVGSEHEVDKGTFGSGRALNAVAKAVQKEALFALSTFNRLALVYFRRK